MKKLLLTAASSMCLFVATFGQNMPSYVPKNGLVCFYPFNGNANDESGNGKHGTASKVTLTADRFGKSNSAYNFVKDHSNWPLPKITASPNLPIGNHSRSISAWVKTSVVNTLPHDTLQLTIVSWGENGNPCILYLDSGKTNLAKNYSSFHSSYSALIPSGNFVSDDKWHNIVFTYDSSYSSSKIFIDGVLKVSKTETFNTSASNLFIGSEFVDQYHMDGTLDDIGIWNRSLTQEEITALYNSNDRVTITIDAPATVKQNDTLEVAINTTALNSSDNIIAYQADFNYDTTRYSYLGSNLQGTLNPSATININNATKGLLKIGYMSQSAITGAGSIAKLKFKANNNLGVSLFWINNFILNTTVIADGIIDTVETINGLPPTAAISYSANPVRKGDSLLITVKFNKAMANSPMPQINLTGANTMPNANLNKLNDSTYNFLWVVEKGNGEAFVNLSGGTDLAGNALISTPTANPSFTVLPTLFGDIDTNKLVQAYDAALALQYSVGLNPLPAMDSLPWSNWRLALANVDTLGSVTANDASLILQKAIAKITSFPADAKLRGGVLPLANITVTQEGNKLVFKATGELYACNIFIKDNLSSLGLPEVQDKKMLVASNISSTTYNIGLASAEASPENTPFLIINLNSAEVFNGNMDIISNTETASLVLGVPSGVVKNKTSNLLVYPNPTKDVISIANAQGYSVKIVDFSGKTVFNQRIQDAKYEVSMKELGAKGVYFLSLMDQNQKTISTQKVILE